MGLFGRKTKKQDEHTKAEEKEKVGVFNTPKKEAKKEEIVKEINFQNKSKKKNAKRRGNSAKVLVRPVITEKVNDLSVYNQYVFEIYPRANKIEVKKAIKEVYGVEPIKVRVLNNIGRLVRSGRNKMTRTGGYKKAIVSLKPGDKIDVYEGV